jgi:cell division protease FtsH
MNRELVGGLLLALLVFLSIQGVAILPWVFLGGSFLILISMLGGKSCRFQVVREGSEAKGQITFSDIGGQEVAKREFQEALEFIVQQDQAIKLGIRPLRGILLSGPPGTGKTLLAKAAARYTDGVFVAASGSEFVEMYAGVGAQRVRELFRGARQEGKRQGKTTAVIFIDEIDVLAGRRGQHSSHLEYDQTLNELLVQMDGLSFSEEVKVLVVGATNRADLLDPAILRPGRFDRVVNVDLPDTQGRLAILKIHTQGKPLAEDVDLESIAKESFGFSGAHLESMTNEAAICALRAGKTKLEMADFREAIDKVIMGEKLDRRPSREERERIAYHELGHAIVAELVERGSVATVTISSRGQALGYTRQRPVVERYLYTEQALRDQIRVCLGGSAAEELILGERSTGSGEDYSRAVELAKKMVHSGLSPLGLVSPDDLPEELLHKTVREILVQEHQKAIEELESYQEELVELAGVLLAKEKLQGQALREQLGFQKAS